MAQLGKEDRKIGAADDRDAPQTGHRLQFLRQRPITR